MARTRIYAAVLFSCLAFSPLAIAKSHQAEGALLKRGASQISKISAPRADYFLTHISTDKPIYRVGEKVYFRGVMLNASDRKPLADNSNTNAAIQIRSPKGEVIFSGTARTQDSVWSFEWPVSAGQAGGEYTVLATYPWQGYAPAERKFDIRAYRAPRLNSQISFLRDGYGPGEKVTATLEVKRAEGGIPAGANVSVSARVDGVAIDGGRGTVDEKGFCSVSFVLPSEISRGEGTLALAIADGGVVETASKTIPILLKKVDLHIYPEGGELIGGFKNRVYVQANQLNGKPADLEAEVLTYIGGGKTSAVAHFCTEHEGRGRFEFRPESNRQYFLKILNPSGIEKTYELPAVKDAGAIISSDKEVFERGKPVTVHLGSTRKKIRVTISKRGVDLATVHATMSGSTRHSDLKTIVLPLPSEADGVLTATVWDEDGLPLAERLIFRQQAKPLNVTLSLDKENYIPGQNASVKVKATDIDGKPVSAIIGVTVTDESVLQMIEKREHAPRLPIMVLLEPEVKDLADAHVYLDENNSKAPLATDLLLGTQGWRRFAQIDVNKFIQVNGDKGRRAISAALPKVSSLGTGIGALAGGRIVAGRIGEFGKILRPDNRVQIPNEIGRVEGPRDMNMFQVEPTVVDERHFSSGRAERHQKTSPTLPDGAPVPDDDGASGTVDRFTFFRSNLGSPVAVVREFAHQVRQNRQANDRSDFQETIYWNAAVKTDANTGEGTINFGLNDSVTTFQVFADAFSNDGSIGATSMGLKSVQPFYAEAKLPLEVTTGDQIFLPISLVNATSSSLANTKTTVDLAGPFKVMPLLNQLQELAAGARERYIQAIDVGFGKGLMNFILHANAGSYEDKVTRQLLVVPKGFPVEKTFGGLLEPGKKISLKIIIDKNVVPESISSNTAVYPTPLANMTGALERMIQEPNGCFEQTSSTSYPLTMAQQYFLSHSGVSPKLIETSRETLDRGYKKLISFWCPDKGYEWFGTNPGHEALTAFGLLHFNDMAQVREVDRDMTTSTRAWLMKQRDGSGGFTRKRASLHTWIEDKDCSNAYILWALLEIGQNPDDLKPEIESLKAAAGKSQNSYVLALAASALYLSGDKTLAKQLMQRLATLQKADGSVDKIESTIVGSGGESLQVEGTALATLAWLRDPQFAGNVEKGIQYLAESCKAGRFGSTQATVLALRTIVNYDKQRARPKTAGKLCLFVDGQPTGDCINFSPSSQDAIKLPDLSKILSAGDHLVVLQMEGGSAMPYSLAVKYNTLSFPTDQDCKLKLSVKMSQDKVVEGASTEANVSVENMTKEAVPTPVAIIGLPGGLEPRHDQLKELVKRGTIDAYEVLGREVVFYWRAMPASTKIEVPISLIAAVPGTYTGPASRAYLYYTDEHKNWADGLRIEIAAKN